MSFSIWSNNVQKPQDLSKSFYLVSLTHLNIQLTILSGRSQAHQGKAYHESQHILIAKFPDQKDYSDRHSLYELCQRLRMGLECG